MSASSIGIIILAAGASRRLGQPKQLVVFQGESLLRRTLRVALGTGCRPVVVVVGAHGDVMAAEAREPGVVVVHNEAWAGGMSTSLRAGLAEALRLAPALEAVLCLVVDQPYLETELLQRLIAEYRQSDAPLVASAYDERPGVPALFHRQLFAELAQLEGDQGARPLFRKYREQLRLVAFPAGRFDVDTPADIDRLQGEA